LRPAGILLLGLLAAACGERPPPPSEPSLARVAFDELPGWAEERHAEALAVFLRSCPALARRPAGERVGPPQAGTAASWHTLCSRAAAVPPGDAAARAFIEDAFVPWRVSVGGSREGLFTGYYEPVLQGARQPDGRYRHALYRRPPDLIAVDLGAFAQDLTGRRVAGRVEGGRLAPYPDRAAIEAGALAGQGLELLWVDDPVALFFLQIQGSGRVTLADGRTVRVGYADQNGRAYRAIGRDLVEAGLLTREAVSLQTIRDWLLAHPDRAAGLMSRNPAYVFFEELGPVTGPLGPPGAQGVPLTPGRSIAVDRRHVPLGTPAWLDATAPYPDGEHPLRRLLIAQDTGGAIKGPIRGDVFWGTGEAAEHTAGHMRATGRWWLLLPREAAPAR